MEIVFGRSPYLILATLVSILGAVHTACANGRLVVTSGPVAASGGGSTRPAPTHDEPPGDLEISYQRVEVEIQNHAVVTKVRQQFRNHTQRVLEGEYLYHLPPEASLSGFAIWDGDDRVAGVIRRREDAREVYDHIVRQQRDPGLVEQVGDTLFRAKVFPIPPLADKKIELEYREMLPVESGLAMYRFPLVTDCNPPQQLRELVVTVALRDGSEIGAAWSPMPGVAVHYHNAHHVNASFEGARLTPTQDFQLFYQVRRPANGLRLLAHRTGNDPGYVMLSVSPPDGGLPARAKEVVFVVDTSGSMEGSRLQQAQRALKFCLGTLERQDRLAMVRFSNEVQRLTDALVPCDDDHLLQARQWVDGLAASGGTDLHGALVAALRSFPPVPGGPHLPRYVVLLTDGVPTLGETDPSVIQKAVREANTVGVRIFTFATHEAVDSHLLTCIARENRGEAISVGPGDDMETELPIFFGKLTTPLFENVRLDWGELKVAQVHPRTVPHFYLGRQVTIVGRYTAPGKGRVRLTAKVEGKPVAYELDATLPEQDPENLFIERLWAQREVDFLLAQAPREQLHEELQSEVVRLSIAHSFVTPFTSFIAIPEKEKRILPEELRRKLERHEQAQTRPVVLPAGSGRFGFRFDTETELNKVFKTIADSGKFGIVLDPGVRAKMTLELDNVEPLVAMYLVANLHGLRVRKYEMASGYQVATYVIAPSDTIERAFERCNTQTVRLKRAKAEDVASMLSKNLGKDVTLGVEHDSRTNSLVMRGSPEDLGRAQRIIEDLDHGSDPNSKVGSICTGFRSVLRSDPDFDTSEETPTGHGRANRRRSSSARRGASRDGASGSGPFADIPPGHWTYEAIQKIAESGVLQGWDNRFHGHKVVNRYQMAVVVARMKDRQKVLEKDGRTVTPAEKARFAALQAEFSPELAMLYGKSDPVRASRVSPVPAHPLTTDIRSADSDDGMDQRWRSLRSRVSAARGESRLLRALVQNLELLVSGKPSVELRPVIERFGVQPSLVRGGEPACISLTIGYPAGARPKVSWRAREGYVLASQEAAAVWVAPPVPGAYTVQVTLTTPSGRTYTEDLEVEVYQPGKITYSPAHLDERLWMLNHSLQELKTEQAALHGALARLSQQAGKRAWLSLDGLGVAAPKLAVDDHIQSTGVVVLRSDRVGAQLPTLTATGGRVEPGNTPGQWTWTTAGGFDWQIVTAEWRPREPFHWLASLPLRASPPEHR